MSTWTESSKQLYRRWGSQLLPDYVSQEEFNRHLGISLGLGAIFNENEAAERAWMNTENVRLGCTPMQAVIQGRSAEVLDEVNRERMP